MTAATDTKALVLHSIDIVEHLQLEAPHGKGTDFTRVICPFHADKNGAASVRVEDGVGFFQCHNPECEQVGTALDAVALYIALNPNKHESDAVKELAKLAGIKVEQEKRRPKADGEIWDVSAWLTGEGADLNRLQAYLNSKDKLCLRIPFTVKGRERLLDVPITTLLDPVGFKLAVMTQLYTSFRGLPKKGPMMRFVESIMKTMDPDDVKDESVDQELLSMMIEQLWAAMESGEELTEDKIEEWGRYHEQGTVKDPKPDWWEDASRFMGAGDTPAALHYKGAIMIRYTGMLAYLVATYGREWNTTALIGILKQLGFTKKTPTLYPKAKRVPVWQIQDKKAEEQKNV